MFYINFICSQKALFNFYTVISYYKSKSSCKIPVEYGI